VYFLLYLARTKWYAKEGWINTGITQGFIVGLVVGIGETLAYPGTIILKFARISSIIVHADSTAIGGYGLDFKNRWLISIFLLIAIAIHSGYNYLTTMTPLEGLWAYSFILLIFIIFLIRRQLLKGKN
jgi:RsiW-degrading membrane proteinase PrsW (M82 family)